jgi:aryl-alcohol dehydrogenase-like predicted oxidoreductase
METVNYSHSKHEIRNHKQFGIQLFLIYIRSTMVNQIYQEHQEMTDRYMELGLSGLRISRVIMGTWQAGREMWAGIDDRESIRAIRSAVDAGITTFDTAEAYGKGHSERILGQALEGVRGKVILATKVFAHNLKYDKVIASCHRSLKNLRTDVIDLYQIHWPAGAHGSRKVPIEETMEALSELKREGKIRALGVSNFSREQLAEACHHGRIDSLQPPYSLFWRHFESDARAYCIENDISVLAYSPLAQGLLTAKIEPGHEFAAGDHRVQNKLFKGEHFKRVQHALSLLLPIAEKKRISMAQLALAWVQAQPNTCAIAGARNADQITENAAAMRINLSGDDLARMDVISRMVTDYLDDNPVMWDF